MLPVIGGLAVQMAPSVGVDPTLLAVPLYFGLLSGATLGGNITPIGASANITAIGILRKEGHEVKNSDFGAINNNLFKQRVSRAWRRCSPKRR